MDQKSTFIPKERTAVWKLGETGWPVGLICFSLPYFLHLQNGDNSFLRTTVRSEGVGKAMRALGGMCCVLRSAKHYFNNQRKETAGWEAFGTGPILFLQVSSQLKNLVWPLL